MKYLFFICHLFVLHGTSVSLTREYFFVSQQMTWTKAQDYCIQHFGNLATITSEEENNKALLVTGENLPWNGLIRTAPHVKNWTWADGDTSNFTKWSFGEPNDGNAGENCVVMDQNGWRDTSCNGEFPSVCSRSFIFVNEKKTWEMALQHCRTQYTSLASMESDKSLQYYQTLLKTETQAATVWIGLRFLDGKWLWVNGMLLGSNVPLNQCPIKPYSCGVFNFNTLVWENRDCNEEHNFLCYHRRNNSLEYSLE
ncbi:macrophage mannose receptor 1-like [Tachysurus fulvidraco]|uniref:macrophage mannose receptor 1-like n=1 Tax=Tachysurus fulvidraco TaxID=1234273 RepID=UPI001FEF4A35|nr:macrophage mannose receptor 1-like [Tachysurus fulvidraco]